MVGRQNNNFRITSSSFYKRHFTVPEGDFVLVTLMTAPMARLANKKLNCNKMHGLYQIRLAWSGPQRQQTASMA